LALNGHIHVNAGACKTEAQLFVPAPSSNSAIFMLYPG